MSPSRGLNTFTRFLVAATFTVLLVSTVSGFSGGSGTQADPYEISNCVELQEIENGSVGDYSDSYELISDIDCSDTVNWNGGKGFEPIGDTVPAFNGSFYGRNKEIIDLYIKRSESFVGLFSTLNEGSNGQTLVTNFTIENATVNATPNGGVQVGTVTSDTSGDVNISFIEVYDSYVDGYSSVGGILGEGDGSFLQVGNTQVVGSYQYAGGIVGLGSAKYSIVKESVNISGSNYVGGVSGRGGGVHNYVYSHANVSGNDYVGGLTGYLNTGEDISQAYSASPVTSTGSDSGGLVGFNDGGTVDSSYWDTQVSGESSSDGGTGLNTDQMTGENASTYMTDFDFTGDWVTNVIYDDYPEITNLLYKSGNGTKSNPYKLSNCEQLENTQYELDSRFNVVKDVNCSVSEEWNNGFNPIGNCGGDACDLSNSFSDAEDHPFTGFFNGKNHTISSLYINNPGEEAVGLFGPVDKGRVLNIELQELNVTGNGNVGAIVGEIHGQVSEIPVYESVQVFNTQTSGTIKGSGAVGGLVGWSQKAEINESFTNVDVDASGVGVQYAAGVLGHSQSGSTYSSVAVGPASADDYAYGIIGNENINVVGSVRNVFWDINTTGQLEPFVDSDTYSSDLYQGYNQSSEMKGLSPCSNELSKLDLANWWSLIDGDYLTLKAFADQNKVITCQPNASFSFSPSSPVSVGTNITFDASASSDVDSDVLTYKWDFDGDGTFENTTTNPIIYYDYERTGNYTVNLTVVDENNAKAYDSKELEAIDNEAPDYYNYGLNLSRTFIGKGEAVNISADWIDEGGLDQAYLATNESTIFENKSGVYNSPVDFNNATDINVTSAFDWQNASVTGSFSYHIWANDLSHNWKKTETRTIDIDTTSPQVKNQTGPSLVNVDGGSAYLSAHGRDNFDLNTSFIATNETGALRNKTDSYQSPQYFSGTSYQLSNFTWLNTSLPEHTTVGWKIWFNDTVGLHNDTDIDTFVTDEYPVVENVEVFKDGSGTDRINYDEDLTVKANVTDGNGRAELDHVLLNVTLPDGSLKLNMSDMQAVKDITINGDEGKTYEYNVSGSTQVAESGRWNVSVYANDTYGGYGTGQDYLIYQIFNLIRNTPEQGNAVLFNNIPFSQELRITNPTNYDFVNGKVAGLTIPNDYVQGSTELERDNGNLIGTTINQTTYEVFWTASLQSGDERIYTFSYDVQAPNVDQTTFTEVNDRKKTYYQYNISTVGETDIIDLSHEFQVSDPDQVTSIDFTVNGTDRSVDPEYQFDFFDSDGDALEDTVQYVIPNASSRHDVEVTLTRGNPIDVDVDTVVTNKPVTSSSVIEWRKGLLFNNTNDFEVDINRKVRLPLRASVIEVEDEFKTKQFDQVGAYVPLQFNLGLQSTASKFVTYETPAIDIDKTYDRADVYKVGQDTFESANVTFQNPYPDKIGLAEASVNILEATNVTVTNSTGDTIAEQDNIDGEYVFNVSNIPKDSSKEVMVKYEVPVANKTYLGTKNVSSGNKLSAWQISSESPVSRKPTRFTTDKFSCVEAQRAFILENNETVDIICDDGDTTIDLDTLGPNEEFKLGVEWKPYHPIFENTKLFLRVAGNNILLIGISLALILISASILYSRIYGLSLFDGFKSERLNRLRKRITGEG